MFFLVDEQPAGPVDDAAEASVPGLDVRRGGLEQFEPVGQPVGDGLWAGGAYPAGGEFDGQRQTGYQTADPAGALDVGGRAQPGPQQPGPLHEELNRLITGGRRIASR